MQLALEKERIIPRYPPNKLEINLDAHAIEPMMIKNDL
jgi:hypothetical protein